MTKRVGELKMGTDGQRQRSAYYEDYAKPVLVNWPFMLVAAATLFLVGHFANRGAGRFLGGDRKKSNNRGGEGSIGRMGSQPTSLAELRALRAEAAEARQKHGTNAINTPGAAKPTPLGMILLLARKVDKLEEEANLLIATIGDSDTLDSNKKKEQTRLVELLTQVQLEIDGVQSDESVRPHRKTQTNRIQKTILSLEAVDKNS